MFSNNKHNFSGKLYTIFSKNYSNSSTHFFSTQMKRILILVLLALVSMCVNTQGQTYVNVQKSITITGNGAFAGTRDNGKLYRYNTVSTGSFYIETQLKSVSDGTKTVAGVGFRNENSPVTLDGSRPSAFIMYSNGKLKAQYRATAGGTYTNSSEVSVTLPCWVRVEKSGNDIVFKYSTTNNTNYQTLTTASGTASAWTNIVQSLAIGSSNTAKDKAVFASLGYGALSTPTTPNCDCGFSVESVTQLTATTGQFTFNSCSVTSLNWKLKNGAGTVLSNGTATITNSATVPFTIPSGTLTGTYTLEATPINCIGTGSKTFTYLGACDCGFTLQSVSQTTDSTGQFIYNSCSVTSLLWNLKNNSGQIIATKTVQNPSSTVPFTIPANSANGSYTIEAIPQNCGGMATQSFNYLKSTPYINVSPTTLELGAGTSSTFISTTSNVSPLTATSSASWLTVSTCGTCGAGYYTVNTTATTANRTGTITFAGGSISAVLTVNQTVTTNSTVKSESNVAKSIPIIANGVTTLPLSNFKSVAGESLTYLDAQQERRHNWAVWWHAGNVGFNIQNIMPWTINLAGADKYMSHFGGYATRGLDYVLTSNPDNSNEAWTIDPQTKITYPPNGVSYSDFISRIYSYNRFEGGINIGTDPNFNNEQWFDHGKGGASSSNFGFGDNVDRNGISKTQRGLVSADVENFLKLDDNMTSFLIGLASGTTGYVDEMYSSVSNEYGQIQHEPVPGSGSFVKRYIDYPDYPNYPNDAQLKPIWDYRNPTKVTITSRGINNKSVYDYPNIQPSSEVSTYYREFLPQGSTDVKSDGSTYTINKFGAFNTWTVASPVVTFGSLIEKWSEYSLNRIGRRFKAMSKLISDRADLGAAGVSGRSNVICNRKWGFIIGLITYMNGADWHIWGQYSNTNTSIDGYVGALAMVKMVETSGGISAFPTMTPQFWDTEYSLDGVNWKKTKAIDWCDSMTDVLPVRTKTGPHKLEVAAFRAEGVEPLEFWTRAVVDGIMRTVHVTASDWETTAPDGTGKEYYYKLITY